jgi:hypothetical protein
MHFLLLQKALKQVEKASMMDGGSSSTELEKVFKVNALEFSQI